MILTMLAMFQVHSLLPSNREGLANLLSTTNREGYAVASPIVYDPSHDDYYYVDQNSS